ncbi:MAG: hypothetical protein ABIB93_06235 [Chloroflexota bacterium]
MTMVNSVLGPLDTAKLGFTLSHEHIMGSAPWVLKDLPELLGENPLERAVADLKKAKEGGVDTIVDATTIDLGRDINFLIEASRRSGVNIIACAGWWLDTPRFFASITADQLAGVFIREIEVGIAGTTVKAGVLKSASDMAGVTADEAMVLRAIARAHHKTGVPIELHSYSPGRIGVQQLAILKEEGVDPKRVKMDHSNDTPDLEYLLWLLEQGCYLGLDRYPGHNLSHVARTRTLKALMDAGYAGRLCLSHDRSAIGINSAITRARDEERLKINPYGYLFIKKVVFPQLSEMGVAEAELKGLCVDGPRNFFEGV